MTGRAVDSTGAEGCFALVLGWTLGWFTGGVRAAVAMKGWEWFVADTFGVPQVGFVEAWGFFLLVSFAVTLHPPTSDDKRPYVVMAEGLLFSLLMSGLVFGSMAILAGFR